MTLPFTLGRKSQTPISRNFIWETIYTAICPLRKTASDYDDRGLQRKTPKKQKQQQNTIMYETPE